MGKKSDSKLRDEFAQTAMSAMIQQNWITETLNVKSEASVDDLRPMAEFAYRIADAMLLERKEPANSTAE